MRNLREVPHLREEAEATEAREQDIRAYVFYYHARLTCAKLFL